MGKNLRLNMGGRVKTTLTGSMHEKVNIVTTHPPQHGYPIPEGTEEMLRGMGTPTSRKSSCRDPPRKGMKTRAGGRNKKYESKHVHFKQKQIVLKNNITTKLLK